MSDQTIEQKYPFDMGSFRLSHLRVMKSAAGYYIGRAAWEKAGGYEEPGSRETEYYKTREAAQQALDTNSFEVRRSADVDFLYANGVPHPKAH